LNDKEGTKRSTYRKSLEIVTKSHHVEEAFGKSWSRLEDE